MSCTQNCKRGLPCPTPQACELPEQPAKPRYTQRPAKRCVPDWVRHAADLLMVICGALFICYLVGVFGPALDSHASEWPASRALIDAQRAGVREFHKDMAAAKLCRETHGESLVRWTAAGELVCVPRHSKQAQRLASNP